MIESTICILIREKPDPEILLGFKKIGFGAGKYTGIGGRIEPGETPVAAAARELQEETGVTVREQDLQPIANLTFFFPARPSWNMESCVFLTTNWDGTPAESNEILPAWFPVDKIPFKKMWQDATYWLPRILAGENLRASFTFKEDNETVDKVEISTSSPTFSPGDNNMDEIASQLIAAAKAVCGNFGLSDDFSAGSVGAAIRTADGNIYTGICIDLACGLGFCAEVSAIAEMLKNREIHITDVVAVSSNGILPPCGRCRETMAQVDVRNLDCRVIIGEDRTVTLRELLPDHWIFDKKDAR